MRITRPSGAGLRRIVVAHEDITEVKSAQEELARLSARLISLQDEERRAIARELHDTTAQNLLAIVLNASRLQEPLAPAGEPARRVLAETLGMAEQSLQEVRTLSYVLHPPLLDELGLTSALAWLVRGFAERSGILVETQIDDAGPLPPETATALFRVAQEALSNIHRHAGSPWARLALRHRRRRIELEVLDRGRGFAAGAAGPEQASLGVGISGMRLRLLQLGGRLEIRSSPQGTRVRASIPLAPPGRPPAG
jgi:signal transduction histidine kinase